MHAWLIMIRDNAVLPIIDICPWGAYLVERWICSAEVQPRWVPFSASQVYLWPPFYLKIGWHWGPILAKCLLFDRFFLSCGSLVVKNYLCISVYMIKSTYWLKKSPFNKLVAYTGIANLLLLSVTFKGVVELVAGHPYSAQIWVPLDICMWQKIWK